MYPPLIVLNFFPGRANIDLFATALDLLVHTYQDIRPFNLGGRKSKNLSASQDIVREGAESALKAVNSYQASSVLRLVFYYYYMNLEIQYAYMVLKALLEGDVKKRYETERKR